MYTRWSCPLCRTAIVLSAVILIVAVPPSVAFALTFTTIDVPGARLTQASGINNRGQIVGWYDDASGGEHGFLLDETGFTTIDVPGAGLTATDGINDRNQIVGGYIGPSGILSFLWDAGSFTTIAVPGARETAAGGINNGGQIVGQYLDASGSQYHGFLWDAGSVTTIDIPGAKNTYELVASFAKGPNLL